jgi:phosphohistidine swiveling domain-containing protein
VIVPAGTKSETLERLAPVVRGAKVLPQVRVTAGAWTGNRDGVFASLKTLGWLETSLIVRSSAQHEDQSGESNAGRFKSIPAVVGKPAIIAAVDAVFASYGAATTDTDQVFIQPFLTDVSIAGVAFTREPSSGSPYIVVNYDLSGDTAAVASGTAQRSETYYFWKHGSTLPSGFLGDVIALLRELETLLGRDALDIEFAVSAAHGLCLLQARPLFVASPTVAVERHREILTGIAKRIEAAARVHPYLHGQRTVFGVMPDWNPAEIIGVRPRPLALSLYRRLVTDQIWAYQRSNYGYKNLRSFPLMLSFHGMPYIDVRVSFNSFIPADVDDDLADRLADHYLERLVASPALHDKIEFEIVHSCYTLDLPTHLARLTDAGIGRGDVAALSHSLRRLTNRVIHDQRGIWRQDLARLEELEIRRRHILGADMGEVDRIYWLLEDCKRWGTLPFAGLARAGFIAMQMLRSMVAVGVLTDAQMAAFLANVDTVTSRMMSDLATLDRPDFLKQYGHLRPGTYDILSARYDEAPERYLGAPQPHAAAHAPPAFTLSTGQKAELTDLLKVHGLDIELGALFDFMRAVIQGRERAKFLFTRSLSDALTLLKKLGAGSGFDAEDMSHADISVIEELYASSADPTEILRPSIAAGRARYAETRSIILPALISDPESVWAFHLPPNEANFITQGTAEGPVSGCEADAGDLKGAIVFIPNADPGFDWIFTKGIAGFVTAYGGVNSHMAIRAQELRMPAVIGAGEAAYKGWRQAKVLRLDCLNKRVEILRT